MISSRTTIIMAAVVLTAAMLTGLPNTEAQSPMGSPMMSPGTPVAAGPAPDCLTALTNVSDCLSYVSVGSNLTAPDKACCPEFAGLLESNPICLCQLIGSAENYGVDLNRALMLPDACKLAIPPLDACPAAPTSAPTSSEAPGSPDEGAMSPGGGAVSPGSGGNGGGSGASTTRIHDLSTVICLAVAILVAYYF